jgi:hypothetical protein
MYAMGILKSFKNGVLSSPKQKQRYFYFKHLISGLCGIIAYTHFSAGLGVTAALIISVGAALLAFLTIAPVVAFLICLFEQMAS